MKIIHVVDSMEVGGAETLVSQMCSLQREQGHEVSVYAVAALGAIGERMRSDGFTVLSEIGRNLINSSRSFLRLFKQSRPHVVHIHNPTPTIYAAPAARLAGASSIISTRHSLVAPPHDRVAEFKYSLAARFCDYVVGICDATTDNLKRLGSVPSEKILRIYNGAAALRKPSSEALPAKTGFTLVFVGRLQPVKNLSLLLNAFKLASETAPDITLWIVGDGSERASLEQLASQLQITNKAKFWGQQLDVAPYFSAADVFIMSSSSEGLPVSLLQAFSQELPSIVTDVGGMAEVVRLANSGLVVPASNANAMSAAILQLANDKREREQFSKNALTAFESRFSIQAMADAYMDFYRNTARSREIPLA